MLQVDLARALDRFEDVSISKISMSGATGELAVGLKTGEVAIFRWERNRNPGQEMPRRKIEAFGLESIVERTDPNVSEGLLPLTLLAQPRGCVTTLKMSDVGFVAAGFADGSVAVVDLRGPALIYDASIYDFAKPAKRGSIRKTSNNQNQAKSEWPTVLEFAVMSLEGEGKLLPFCYCGCTNAL
jgi:hypothetical protein